MITTPRRAVTRFFIPLIDVLILLFCIFLLMPFVSNPTPPDAQAPAPPQEQLPKDVATLQRDLKSAKDRIARMEAAAQAALIDRVIVRVLFVGKDAQGVYLYHFDDTGRREIRNGTQALQYVTDQTARAARAGGTKELKFEILYPRDESGFARGYPNAKEEALIRGWFGAVPVVFQ